MTEHTQQYNVLLAVPNIQLGELYSHALTESGHSVTTVNSAEEARAHLRSGPHDLAILAAAFDDEAGNRLAYDAMESPGKPEVIVLVQHPQIDEAVALAKAGAFDYLPLPVLASHLADLVLKAGSLATSRRHDTRAQSDFDEFMRAFLVSSVPAVQEMAILCRMVASRADACAVIVGEPGSGTNLVSRTIHWLSPQLHGPLVTANLVDAVPEALEDQLFGSAFPRREGMLTAATGGTLLLQELPGLPHSLQPRLLEVLETGTIRHEYGGGDWPFRARVLATAQPQIETLVAQNQFDSGLYYRLASIKVVVPPLRERPADIPRIAETILAQVAVDSGRLSLRLSGGALGDLVRHNWPGNLRELRNLLTRVALLCPNDAVTQDDLQRVAGSTWSARPSARTGSAYPPSSRSGTTRRSSAPAPMRGSGIVPANLDEPARAEVERIESALMASDGHRERAAAMLGMSRTTLWTRMCVLGIDHERFQRAKAQ